MITSHTYGAGGLIRQVQPPHDDWPAEGTAILVLAAILILVAVLAVIGL